MQHFPTRLTYLMNSHTGYFGPFVVPAMRHFWRLVFESEYRILQGVLARKSTRTVPGNNLFLLHLPRPFSTELHYLDMQSTRAIWELIMCQKIYDLGPLGHRPFFLDCGANIGLAQLFWKQRYGNFESVAWEPDPRVSEVLQKNVQAWRLPTEVRVFALSDRDGILPFSSSGDDAGHISDKNTAPASHGISVPTERLGPFLSRPVDLLKMDIEGAENQVLRDIRGQLANVKNIFVEFHLRDRSERLSELLSILETAGFKCRIEDRIPHWKKYPFAEFSEGTEGSMHCGHIYCKRLMSSTRKS